MLQSKIFMPLLKDSPVEAKITSHQLMLKSGMIRQHASGIYNWLPLGLKVLRNIENIIRRNLDEAGFQEILMSHIQSAQLWQESNRFDSYGKEMLKIKDRHDNDLLFGPTNEEAVTDLVRNIFQSYKDLPKVLYQIQWKFRDEIRPRFGVMRGREFLMKDAYSFDIDEISAQKTYDKIMTTYMKIFADMKLKAIPMKADTGPVGGDMSHEFMVIADTGESKVFYDKKIDDLDVASPEFDIAELKSLYAATEDIHDDVNCALSKDDLVSNRAIEVGHIFNFADKYSSPMNARVNNEKGELKEIYMGSYGIGVSRLVAAIIEVYHDDKGIIWPASVAPFKVSIICMNIKDEKSVDIAKNLYKKCQENNIDAIFDDTDSRAGVKFANADLIGSPVQVIIGARNSAQDMVEIKNRADGNVINVQVENAYDEIIKLVK